MLLLRQWTAHVTGIPQFNTEGSDSYLLYKFGQLFQDILAMQDTALSVAEKFSPTEHCY